MFIKSPIVRRTAYLTLVRSHLGYATQLWTPQSVDLMRKIERVQRRATKFILSLPFFCEQSYTSRLIELNLLPISYWHELLDMIFFFKSVTGIVNLNSSVVPKIHVTRVTRSYNPDSPHFFSRKCKTTTFQRSFLNRTTRIWNTLSNDINLSVKLPLSQFKSLLYNYYLSALKSVYDPENPRSWKSICPYCNSSRSLNTNIRCCF